MRPDRMVLSAYIDGEVPERFIPDIESAIANDPEVRAEYETLLALQRRFTADPPVDLEASAERSWNVLSERVSQIQPRRDVWHRRIAIPFPAFAAAATVVVALAGILVWSLLSQDDQAGAHLARGNDVDVTIRVDGPEMEQVLQWLVDKNMLGEVNIQLPERRFQIVGEPVFVKPAAYPGEVRQ